MAQRNKEQLDIDEAAKKDFLKFVNQTSCLIFKSDYTKGYHDGVKYILEEIEKRLNVAESAGYASQVRFIRQYVKNALGRK